MLRKLLQPFYTAYVLLSFVVCLLAAFPFFVLISIGNNIAARKAIYTIIRYWSEAWLWLIGMPVKRLGPKPPKGKYVVVANHISYMDTLVIFPGIPSYFRALGKKEISKIPVLGYVYKQIIVPVDRSKANSRAKSMRLMWRVLKYESNIVIFPEGTFNENPSLPLKDFYDGAFRLAINAQTPILPMILVDTVDRWHYSHWWKLWPGKNRIVYMQPVEVSGLHLADVPALKQKVFEQMEAELRKYRQYV